MRAQVSNGNIKKLRSIMSYIFGMLSKASSDWVILNEDYRLFTLQLNVCMTIDMNVNLDNTK